MDAGSAGRGLEHGVLSCAASLVYRLLSSTAPVSAFATVSGVLPQRGLRTRDAGEEAWASTICRGEAATIVRSSNAGVHAHQAFSRNFETHNLKLRPLTGRNSTGDKNGAPPWVHIGCPRFFQDEGGGASTGRKACFWPRHIQVLLTIDFAVYKGGTGHDKH